MSFDEKQLRDFKAYEKMRKLGRYNVFDPRARRLTGLSEEAYTFVMNNYSALKAALDEKGAK